MRRIFLILVSFLAILSSCKKEEEKKNADFLINSGFEKKNNFSFNNYAINSIVVDTLGYLWVGTNAGLFLLDNNNYYELSSFKGKAIHSLTSHNYEILVASTDGAYTIKVETESISILNTITKDDIRNNSGSMSVYSYGLKNNRWIGSPDGLAYFDGLSWSRNEEIRNNLGGISDVSCMAFRADDCFVGTYGKFLFHIMYNDPLTPDAISGASQMLGSYDNPDVSFNGELTTDTVFCLFAGSDTSIWFGSNAGLTRNKGNTRIGIGIFEYFLRGQRVLSLIETSDKRICAGTENGLNLRTDTVWTSYNTTNGLPGNIIYCVAEDKDLSVWVGTNKGISHLVNGTFTNF